MRRLPVVVVLALSFGPLLWAEPLDRHQVSADAKWLAHIDMDAAKAAKVAQRVHDDWLSNEEAKQALRTIRATIGIDLLKGLHSISFYGTRFVPESGVAIVRAKVDRQLLMSHLSREPSHQRSAYGDHELHTWTQKQGTKYEHTLTGCFHQPTVVVLGRDAAEVKIALDVLDGKSASLSGSGSPLDIDPPSGAVFAAAAAGLADLAGADVPFLSPIVRQSELVFVAVGEHDGEVYARARLVAKSAESAGQIRDVVEGLRAMAELQHSADGNLTKVLQSLKVTTAEKVVTVDWKMIGDGVLELIEKELARRQGPKQAD